MLWHIDVSDYHSPETYSILVCTCIIYHRLHWLHQRGAFCVPTKEAKKGGRYVFFYCDVFCHDIFRWWQWLPNGSSPLLAVTLYLVFMQIDTLHSLYAIIYQVRTCRCCDYRCGVGGRAERIHRTGLNKTGTLKNEGLDEEAIWQIDEIVVFEKFDHLYWYGGM